MEDLNKLLNLFSYKVEVADVISAKIQSQISTFIVKQRIDKNMDIKEFAEFMGVPYIKAKDWECSDYNFTIRELASIATKLDSNVDITFS